MDKKFIKVRSLGDIAVSSLILVAGIACILIPQNEVLNMSGIFIAPIGLLMLLFRKTAYKDVITGDVFRRHSLYFACSEKFKIEEALVNNNFSTLDFGNKGESVMLLAYYNQNDTFIQLYEYVPHYYSPYSEWHHFPTSQVRQSLLGR